MSAHKLACKECLLLTPTHYHTHSLTVYPLTHSQLVKHSQASHLINLDIFEEVSSPKKRTQIFEALVLVNPFSKFVPFKPLQLHALVVCNERKQREK